jgi:hypothetical protein
MRPALDEWFRRAFDDDAPARLGSGWVSGTASVFLGAVCAGATQVLRHSS